MDVPGWGQVKGSLGRQVGPDQDVTPSDKATGLSLVAYQYLRSIRYQIRKGQPGTPCGETLHKSRQAGSGEPETRTSRVGALDKLYDPAKLRREYQRAELQPRVDDGRPLKVSNGQLIAVPPAR